eukprot:1158918-Pelagomonas_calceolata.AAC.7
MPTGIALKHMHLTRKQMELIVSTRLGHAQESTQLLVNCAHALRQYADAGDDRTFPGHVSHTMPGPLTHNASAASGVTRLKYGATANEASGSITKVSVM